MANDPNVAELVEDLRVQLRTKEHEVEVARAALHDAQMAGVAVGVLLARTPGWTEQDALAAWDGACARLTRDGNTRALASYVMQTGGLPGEGVTARAYSA